MKPIDLRELKKLTNEDMGGDFFGSEEVQRLIQALEIYEKALKLIAGPSEFNCGIGEGNKMAAAEKARAEVHKLVRFDDV